MILPVGRFGQSVRWTIQPQWQLIFDRSLGLTSEKHALVAARYRTTAGTMDSGEIEMTGGE